MPDLSIMLSFSDHNDQPSYPSALMAQRAGSWAAERGQYRIAQQLLGLAAALEAYELERDLLAGPNTHNGHYGVPPHCPEHDQPMIRGLDEWLCACSLKAAQHKGPYGVPDEPPPAKRDVGDTLVNVAPLLVGSGQRDYSREHPSNDAPTERIDVSGAVSVVTEEGHLIHPSTGLCFSACPHASHKEK